MNPVFSTVDFICGSVPTSCKRPSCSYSSSQPSRSSTVWTEGPLGNTLEHCGQRPSTAQMKDPVPFVSIIRVHPAVACYSAHPPSTPLYLMPISSSLNEPNRFNNLQQMSKIKVHTNSKKIVKKVLRSILNSVLTTVAPNEFTRNHVEISVTKKSYQQKLCDVAIQTRPFNLTNRCCSSEYEDYSSNCSDSSWGGQLRALRDSHVRLVLRQLRQLRDIDRLDRAVHRPHPPPCTLDSIT